MSWTYKQNKAEYDKKQNRVITFIEETGSQKKFK